MESHNFDKISLWNALLTGLFGGVFLLIYKKIGKGMMIDLSNRICNYASRVQSVILPSQERTIFLCGASHNDEILYLYVSIIPAACATSRSSDRLLIFQIIVFRPIENHKAFLNFLEDFFKKG